MTPTAINLMSRNSFILLFLLFLQPVGASDEIRYAKLDGLREFQGISVVATENTLHALAGGLWDQEPRPALYYLTSTDGGLNWHKVARLSYPQDPPLLSKSQDSMRLAVRGPKRVAVWRSQGEIPGSGELTLAYSSDQGKTWRRGKNPATGDTSHNQSYPDIVLDRWGKTHVVWLDDREEKGNVQGLRYAESRDGANSWSPEQTLDDTTCTCCWTRLTLLADRTPAVLYRGSEPHDMKVRIKSHTRDRWDAAHVAGRFGWHFSGCPHCGGALLATSSANAGLFRLHAVVWTGKSGYAGLYHLHSSDGGRHWQGERLASENSRNPDMATRDNRHLGLIHTEGSFGHQILKFIHSADAGKTWNTPITISRPDTHAEYPQIVSLLNRYIVFWTEKTAHGMARLAVRQIL
jgi:hypothetical protein